MKKQYILPRAAGDGHEPGDPQSCYPGLPIRAPSLARVSSSVLHIAGPHS